DGRGPAARRLGGGRASGDHRSRANRPARASRRWGRPGGRYRAAGRGRRSPPAARRAGCGGGTAAARCRRKRAPAGGGLPRGARRGDMKAAALLLALLLVAGPAAAQTGRRGSPSRRAFILALPGLSLEDVTPARMPVLARLAGRSGVALVNVV